MKKIISPVEIDMETGNVKETLESRLSYYVNRVKSLTNPYVGNKRKILEHLVIYLRDLGVEYDSVVDLFSGSACVSILMKLLGKRVVSNDILLSSYHYAKAFVENVDIVLSDEEIEYLFNNKNENINEDSFEEWSERFKDKEVEFLVNFRMNVLNLFNDEKDNNIQIKRSLAFANISLYIMDHCFVGGRLNHGQVLAELNHRLSHNKNRDQAMGFHDIHWYSFNDKGCSRDNLAVCGDAISLLRNGLLNVDMAYIDPPYGGQQSDYSHMYEFFERYGSEFFTVSNSLDKSFVGGKNYLGNCRRLFYALEHAKHRIPTWVISYNNSGHITLDEMKEEIKEYRSQIDIKEVEYDYKHRSENNKDTSIEYLIVVR